MKTTFLSFLLLMVWAGLMAQAPQAFKYQAVARNSTGELLANKPVSFRISFLSGSTSGTTVYSEIHLKTTNTFGLVDLEIGKGSAPTGDFTAIGWGSSNYYIKIEIDPSGGTAYQNMGTSQLLSVPFALYAKDVQNKNDADADPANELQKITISGTVLTLDKSGGSVTLPSSGSGDNWGTQVVKTNTTLTGQGTDASPLGVVNNLLTPSWANIHSIPAGFADGTDNVDDADNSFINEIQVLSLSGNNLSLSKEGGTITIPGDRWGTQVVATDATLTGNGTVATPLGISDNSVTSSKILDNTVTTADLATNAVTTAKIADNAVSVAKLPAGAAADKYLRGDGIWAIPSAGSITETDPTWNGAANETATIGRSGRVGIGTTSPTALLHILGSETNNGSVLFVGQFNEVSMGSPPYSGEGTRMMWYPVKAAFRAGQVSGSQWDASNIGNHSTALGYNNIASGSNSLAAGSQSKASGKHSIALGDLNDASGENSIALGFGTDASGPFSVTMGENSIASGRCSFAMGSDAKASGTFSTSMGQKATASGYGSIALGHGTRATAYHSIALGFFNKGGGDPNSWIDTDPLFEIGNGLPGDEKNAVTVLKNGRVGIGSNAPTQALHVVGNAYKTVGGTSWATSSDIRLKILSGSYNKGLNEITALKPVRYVYKPGNLRQLDSETEQIGFIAQEVQKIFPEAVTEAKDGYLDFNIHAINVAMVNAIKELKTENERQQAKIETLENRLSKLESLLEITSRK